MVLVASTMAQSSSLVSNHLPDIPPSSSVSVSTSSPSPLPSSVPDHTETSCPFAQQASSSSNKADEVTELLADVSLEKTDSSDSSISFFQYRDETQMPLIMKLIQKDLSEPYSIYTYRYFIHNWPNLCFLAMSDAGDCVGAIVCKLDLHKKVTRRGYIAMLAVDSNYRKKKIGSTLVKKAIEAMIEDEADEVVLETEITNKPALKLYENLGFVRDKRLFRYYLNGVDASRLKLWLR